MTARTQTNRWSLVVAAGLMALLGQLNGSVVVVVLPTVKEELELSAGAVQWVMLGFVVPMIALALSAGRWVDRIGARPAVLAAGTVLAMASIGAAAAGEAVLLVGSRIVQGGAAAVLLAAAPKLAVSAVSPEARGRALAVVGTLAPVGAVTGPLLGGFLVAAWGWSSVFLVNLPLLAVMITVVAQAAPRSGRLDRPPTGWLAEVGLLGVAATAFLLGVTPGSEGQLGAAWLVPVALLAGAIWWRSGHAADVRQILAVPTATAVHLAFVGSYVAVMAVQFLTPFALADHLQASPASIGLTMASYPASAALAGPLAGWLSDRRSTRRVAAAGAAVLSVGTASLVMLGEHWSPMDMAWRLGLVGLGFGLFVTPNQALALALAGDNRAGLAAATSNLARSLGLALGPAVAALLWASTGRSIDGIRTAMAAAALAAAVSTAALATERKRPAATEPRTELQVS